MENDITYWQKVHTRYSNQNWINEPTVFAKQAIKYFPKTGLILDLGAGQCQDTFYFAKKGYKVVACDLSEFALNLAKQKMPFSLKDKIEFKIIDFNKTLPFKPKSFDIVYSHLALHYFTEKRTQNLFDEIFKILKIGGIFATITNSIDDPEITEFKKIPEEYYSSPEGLKKRYFSLPSMAKFTQKFKTLLLDNQGETYKDRIKTLIRFIGKKSR